MKAFRFPVALLFFLFFVSLSACREQKQTLVLVKVLDQNNHLVSGATVKLYPTGPFEQGATPVLYKEGTTDQDGRIWFNFDDVYQLGQAGVAVLTVEATKSDMNGYGIIKVEQETTNKESVFIAP